MQLLIRFFSEITIKSSSVRKRMINRLKCNINTICRPIDNNIQISGKWDFLLIKTAVTKKIQLKLIKALSNTPGINHFVEIEQYPWIDLNDVAKKCIITYFQTLSSFAVRVKRAKNHNFTSVDAERFIGAEIVKHTGCKVTLENPAIKVKIIIKNDEYFLLKKRYSGIGGFPLGTQGSTLSLLSGGYDSAVSSFLTIKRGILTHFCFFDLGGGYLHETTVKELAIFLWKKYESSHAIRFIIVPFAEIVNKIVKSITPSLMGVILKKMMLLVATKIAHKLNISSLTTGEAIAQVSSQTLANLSVLDTTTELLILRPLIIMNKQDIIDTAKKIETLNFSGYIPEFCAAISKKPTVCAKITDIARAEKNFDFSLLQTAVDNSYNYDLSQLENDILITEIDIIDKLGDMDKIINIEPQKNIFLNVDPEKIINIPFYQLDTDFVNLDTQYRYLLYCSRGIMSHLHAVRLRENGHKNIGVYRNENFSNSGHG